MERIKSGIKQILYKIRNPEYDENEKEFQKQLGAKRLLILIPFIIAAALFLLLSLSK